MKMMRTSMRISITHFRECAIAFFALVAASFSINATEFRAFNALCKESDRVIVGEVQEGSFACSGLPCTASIYTLRLSEDAGLGERTVSKGTKKKGTIKFSSSAKIHIGDDVLVFLKALKKGQRNVLFSIGGGPVSYPIPKDVRFMAAEDAVFTKLRSGYFREIPVCGESADPDCQRLSGTSLVIANAQVKYVDSDDLSERCVSFPTR